MSDFKKHRVTRVRALTAAAIVALAALGAPDSVTLAQDKELPVIVSESRPKVRYDGYFRLKATDGRHLTSYDSAYYFEEGKRFEAQDAHVFYAPPFHLVTEKGRVKHVYDEKEGLFTLYLRRPATAQQISKQLRDVILGTAKQKTESGKEILPSTLPYRISVLPLTTAYIEFSRAYKDESGVKHVVKSAEIQGISQDGNLAIHFYDVSKEWADKIIKDLQEDVIQVVFRYGFRGTSTATRCIAKFHVNGGQDIALFKSVEGKGGKGVVARHQVVNLADQLVERELIDVQCIDGHSHKDVTEILLDRLRAETREVASWEKLDEVVAFDADSFKADVIRELKTIDNRVVRKQALDAFSKSMSEAESKASQEGVSVGWGNWGAAAEISFSEASSNSSAEARKEFTDTLRKLGYSMVFRGKKFSPKSVDVHRTEDLRAQWNRKKTISFGQPVSQEGRGSYALTKGDRTAMISVSTRADLEQQIAALKKTVETQGQALKEMGDKVRIKNDDAYIRAEDEVRIKADRRVRIRARNDVTIRANDDADIKASDDVTIRAEDDAYIRAEDEVRIKADRRVRIRARNDVTIRANDDAYIRAKDEVTIRAKKVYIDGEVHINGKPFPFR